MNFIRGLSSIFAVSVIILGLGFTGLKMSPARAATVTWDNDADAGDGSNTDFNNPFNWGPGQTGTVPGALDNATFTGAAVSSPNLSAADTISGLTFLAGASGYTL